MGSSAVEELVSKIDKNEIPKESKKEENQPENKSDFNPNSQTNFYKPKNSNKEEQNRNEEEEEKKRKEEKEEKRKEEEEEKRKEEEEQKRKEEEERKRREEEEQKRREEEEQKRKEEEEKKRREEEEQKRKEEEEKKRKEEEEKKRKEEEEKKRKEEEEQKRKEEEKKKRKEEEEKKRKEEEEKKKKEEEEKKIKEKQINLFLLLKNLEAVNKDIECLRESIHKVFESFVDSTKDFNDLKKSIISKVLKNINEYLGLDENDNDDTIKKILIDSFEEKNNINDFQEYLDIILNSVNLFYKISNKNEIIAYIVNYLNPMTELLKELTVIYDKIDFIDYEDFTKIVKENEIAMDEIAMEYLLFRMKINKTGKKMKFRQFNIQTFKQFFDENILKEEV